MNFLNLVELEAEARSRLEATAFDYYASGAHDEVTLRANRAAFERIALHYRVLVDVSRRATTATVLGQELSMPVLVAPTAFHKLAHPEGELATARAAGAEGTVMILSSLSTTRVEDVANAGRCPIWFQLYVYKDRQATIGLVRRVEAAGCRALVLTVDAPILGRRERDVRNRFHLPGSLRVENMAAEGYGEVVAPSDDSGLASYVATRLDASLGWDVIAWLRSVTSLPILVKGIVRPDDASRAVMHGAAGIVVSNHGGRQLDTAPATIDVLARVVDAVDGRVPVLLDGGVRRGTDVLKALALGARAVLVGRPILWGLALGGEEGVRRVLALLRAEIDEAMALCGCPRVTDVTRDLLA
jgi:4-hydroxymandelate oxidase